MSHGPPCQSQNACQSQSWILSLQQYIHSGSSENKLKKIHYCAAQIHIHRGKHSHTLTSIMYVKKRFNQILHGRNSHKTTKCKTFTAETLSWGSTLRSNFGWVLKISWFNTAMVVVKIKVLQTACNLNACQYKNIIDDNKWLYSLTFFVLLSHSPHQHLIQWSVKWRTSIH